MKQMLGERVLVIGTGAMGVATARLALAHGAAVTLVGRDETWLRTTAAAAAGGTAAVGDVEEPEHTLQLLIAGEPFHHVAVLSGSGRATQAA